MVVGLEPQGDFLGTVFRKIRKSKSAFRLHRRARIACEPPPWNAKCGSKLCPTHTDPSNHFFYEKYELAKQNPERCPDKQFYFVRSSLGRPLAQHWCSNPFFNTENAPEVAPKCNQELKITPKGESEGLQTSKVNLKGTSGTLARRTARSAYRSAYNPPASCLQGILGVLDQKLNSCLIMTP